MIHQDSLYFQLLFFQSLAWAYLSVNCSFGFKMITALKVPSYGNAGFEFFSIDYQNYIVAANFWDGLSSDMSAMSTVHKLIYSIDSQSYSISTVQELASHGAHGVDYFITQSNESLLVIPSYYGCGSNRREIINRQDCYSTRLHRWNAARDRFDLWQELSTGGPSQTTHFRWGGRQFVAVAENMLDRVAIFQLSPPPVPLFQRVLLLRCPGAAGLAVAEELPFGRVCNYLSYYFACLDVLSFRCFLPVRPTTIVAGPRDLRCF